MRLGLNDRALGYDVGGYVLYDESRGRYLTKNTAALITAAGPLANLITTIIAISIGNLIDSSLGATMWGAFGFTSLAAFVVSAWPFRLRSGRGNDALELVQILSPARSGPKRRWGKPARSPWQAP